MERCPRETHFPPNLRNRHLSGVWSRGWRWCWRRRWSCWCYRGLLHLKCANIPPSRLHSIKTEAALIVNQWRLKIVGIVVRVTRVDGWAVRQERMSNSRAAVVLQRANLGISIHLITSGAQVIGTVVAAEIVAI